MNAIQEATKYAIQIPMRIMEESYISMEVMKVMAEKGNPNSITDAAVGALCARSAVIGAFLNVKINCIDFKDKDFVEEIIKKGEEIVAKSCALESEILDITNSKI